jgi:EpsI family protein
MLMANTIKLRIIICLIMVTASVSAAVLTPSIKMADHREKFSLEKIVPESFGQWTIDEHTIPLQVDPSVQKTINSLYNQVLSRTYVDRKGGEVMLSIAYGGDQSDYTTLHRPEVCYTAQGFNVIKTENTSLETRFGNFPVKRLVAERVGRYEPITYWMTIGNKVIVPSTMNQKLQQIRLGMQGQIPDGVLVRVSSVGIRDEEAFKLQNQFIEDMLNAISMNDRKILVGEIKS